MPVDDKKNKLREEALIKACQRNERRAQSEFFHLYAGKFLGIAYRFAGDYDTANDLVQEGFIRIFRHISDYRFQGSFEGWMRRIMINTSINYIKQHGRMMFDEIDDERDLLFSEPSAVMERMNCEEIIEEVNRLPQGFRTIINLYAIEGFSYAEIADMLEIKEVTVRSQYLRAKQKLAKILAEKNIAHYATKII